MEINLPAIKQSRAIAFVWQHLFLLISLFIMTLGVALCIRSALGSSVISSLPYVLSLAGVADLAPALSVGGYTVVMNVVLVGAQMLTLRRQFEWVQLFQLVIGFVFGWFIDLSMLMVDGIPCDTVAMQAAIQAVGCTIMGIGIAFEVRCGSVTMPGEGITIAITRVTGRPFARIKIAVDITLVVLAVAAGYAFFGHWVWNVVGVGTLFAMVYVGMVVKTIAPHLGWFDRIVTTPGMRRYVFGLARFLSRNK